MAEMERQGSALTGVTLEGNDFAALLKKEFKPKTEEAKSAVEQAVQTLAQQQNLKVIYDAAQAHLATYKTRGIGAFGDAVTYSFYATKNLTTGEGGAITCDSRADAARLRRLRVLGMANDTWQRRQHGAQGEHQGGE